MRSQPRFGELATALLVVALLAEGFQLVVAGGSLRTRALEATAVALIALVIGARYGRARYRRERIREVGWLPRELVWQTDPHGVRHAIVTQNSGEAVSIQVPPTVEQDDLMAYVLVRLNERHSRGSRRSSG